MFALKGWQIETGHPLSGEDVALGGALRWQDSATPLSIWQIGDETSSGYRLRLGEVLEVDVLPNQRIVSRARREVPQVTVDHFLADQVFPRLLAHIGELVVHAGAVRVDDGALMLVGHSGSGKSTAVASFDQAGLALIGDDAMVITSANCRSQIRSVYPSLRLMPDSIAALMPGTATAGLVAHYSTKERIDVAGNRPASEVALPILAIFAIGEATEQVAIRSISAARGCMALVENSFSLDPSDVSEAAKRLDAASAVARNVPMFQITYPRDYARLPEVRAAILGQVATLEPA